MKTETQIHIQNWPLLKPESNRERIILALREADGVVEQCRGWTHQGASRCAVGIIYDLLGAAPMHKDDDNEGWASFSGAGDEALVRAGVQNGNSTRIWLLNDDDGLTFAQMADHLEADDSFWNQHADEKLVP